MTKVRKFSRGDLVKYNHMEWVVKRKKPGMLHLIRRQVNTGPPIWVPSRLIKHADISWRTRLKVGDPVELLLGGHWLKAKIFRREGNKVCVQPSFSTFTIRLSDQSGHIAQSTHEFPLWREEIVSTVFHMGRVCVERGKGLMFPWTYGNGIPISPMKPKLVTTLKFPLERTKGFPMSMYNILSAEEIMQDIVNSASVPPLLKYVAIQYVRQRTPRYQLTQNDNLRSFIEAALQQNDTERVNELLSIGEHSEEWSMAEFAIFKHLSRPYFEVEIRVAEELEVDLLYTGLQGDATHAVSMILQRVSQPIDYKPDIIKVSGSPEIQYTLSRMLGMESEPLQALHLRHVNNLWLTRNGFCQKVLNSFGGMVDVYNLDYVLLVKELVRRSPFKTLVVVECDTIHMWKGFSKWYGNQRDDDLVVVTTRSTLIRSWTSLRGFKRLVCTTFPSTGSVYHHVVTNMECKIRWALGSMAIGWNIFDVPYSPRAVITLSKEDQEAMGVCFPSATVQKVICRTKLDHRHILRNTMFMSDSRRREYMSRYLMNTSLVPPHISGEALETYEGTIESISKNFNLKESLLKERTKEKCSVCLETINKPAVTQCGHVFCSECASELHKREVNCPMCRSDIDGFMRVSDQDTEGKVVMYKGMCYRVSDKTSWGSKYRFLKQHSDATFITKYASVKRALKKAFPDTSVLSLRAVQRGVRVQTTKVIMIEPDELPDFNYAWGKDKEILQLCYSVTI